ncbi:MAG: hypothetical protein Q8R45_13705 [Brevundimonas sp.]|uniref:hypothetical protein n=1 Tax=Brevundimonas sp. TaxID=1871086 RepID=UPI0027343900|nr:hypothetical protein [Brevundimonas sp.]MDP3658003.1 hypothetical protein [Brevundimonas sp.]
MTMMLAKLFGARTFLDPEVEQWHLDVWATLIERFNEGRSFADTPVALPTRDFFPPTEATGHAKAEHVFDCVKAIMRMPDWPCVLEPQPRRTTGQQVAQFVHIAGDEAPNGTFRVEPDGVVVITYARDLLDDPMALVATLAHELSHYLLASEADLVEDETHELMTDLTVAFAGLGVFGANSAFSFEQHGDAFSQGWRSRSSGYLSPRSWAFALAVFGELRGDDGGMANYLKPEIEGLRRQAVKYLRKKPELLGHLRPVEAGSQARS